MGDEASALIFDDEDGEDGSAKKKHTKRKSVRGADMKGGRFGSSFFKSRGKLACGE